MFRRKTHVHHLSRPSRALARGTVVGVLALSVAIWATRQNRPAPWPAPSKPTPEVAPTNALSAAVNVREDRRASRFGHLEKPATSATFETLAAARGTALALTLIDWSDADLPGCLAGLATLAASNDPDVDLAIGVLRPAPRKSESRGRAAESD